MNYYAPREIADESGKGIGKWRYTVRNDDRIFAVGYCGDVLCEHDTPEEAREHYREYQLDNAHEINLAPPGAFCRICQTPTMTAMSVDQIPYALCAEHMNRDSLASMYSAGDAISSW